MKSISQYVYLFLLVIIAFLEVGCKNKEYFEEKVVVDSLQVMDESEIEDFDKYYKPAEFEGIDMLRSDAK